MSAKKQIRGAASWLQDHWDIRAAGNFIGGGTGTGFLVMSAATILSGGITVTPLVLISLAFVGFGLFCVWLEIGRMFRAANVIRHPQTSWMSREALVAVPLSVGGLFAAYYNDTKALLAVAGIGLVFLYCQARILQASKGIPAWRTPVIVPLILVTGLVEGAGMMGAVGWGLISVDSIFWLPPVLLILLLLRYAIWWMYLGHLIATGMPAGALKAFKIYNPPILFGGHLAPAVLLGLGTVLPIQNGLYAVILGASLALIGGWLIKYVIVTKAAFNQGFQLPHEPVRGQGRPGPMAKPGWTTPGSAS